MAGQARHTAWTEGCIHADFAAYARFPVLDSAKGQTLRCRPSLGQPAL